MELFRLTCVTCQASLSVRDRAVIGKILSCPRCGSMVQVTAPSGSEDHGLAANDSSSPLPVTSSESSAEVHSGQEEDVSQEDTSECGPGKPVWHFVASGFRRQVIGWSVAGMAAVGTFVVVLTWSLEEGTDNHVANGHGVEPEQSAGQQETVRQGAMNLEASESADLIEPVATAVAEGTPQDVDQVAEREHGTLSEASVGPSIEDSRSGNLALDRADADTLLSRAPSLSGSERDEISAVKSRLDVREVDRTKPTAHGDQSELPRFDPLDLDPEGLDLASLGRKKTKSQEGPSVPSINPEEPDKSRTGVTSQPSPTTVREPGAKPSSHRTDNLNTQVVRIDPAAVPLAKMPVAEEQLKVQIPAIEVDRMPLYIFLELISDLGDVPIRWGPEELRMAAISAETPVSIRKQQSSLAEILHEVLQSLHLDYRAAGPLIVIHWPGAERSREINYPIADLVTPATDAGQLAEWIRQLIVPSSWRSVAGKGAAGNGEMQIDGDILKITQSQRVHYQVLCFLERLRLARKLKLRSRYPVERLTLEPALQQLAESLQEQITFTFSRYTPLKEIFSYWQQQLGLALLVDWSAILGDSSLLQHAPVEFQQELAGRREEPSIGPATPVACAVAGLPWHQALDTILEPLGLAWQAIDGSALQITSAEVVQGTTRLEFYSLVPERAPGPLPGDSEIMSSVTIMAELQSLVDESNSKLLPRSQTALILDPVSQHVLVLQPAIMQRQIWQRINTTRLAGE
ncbi:MAG: hypothetical protein ABGX16_00570 [Pirellulales bacterium]